MVGQGPCATGAAACIAADHARAFVDGRLAPAERAAVEQRIAACAACRVVVEAARRAAGPLAADRGDRTAVQRGRAPANPAVRIEPAVASLPRRPDHSDDAIAQTEEVIELVGGRPATAPHGAKAPFADALTTLPDRAAAHRGDPPPPLEVELIPGEIVGRYVVERPLGAGGMGVVSLARDPELRRPVVIKLVHPNVGHGEGGDELEARLRREAQAMAQVSHANVVQIFDIGRRGDRVFLAMEFIAGRTLDVWLLEKPRTHDEILGVFRQAGAGLAAAHRVGLVHRDFKPTNVLVGNDGVVKVTDFGLARSFTGAGGAGGADPAGAAAPFRSTRRLRVAEVHAAGAAAAGGAFDPLGASRSPQPSRPSGVHAVLTQVDSVVGTPAYMAPEQTAGGRIDARTDQYAMAVTLVDALLGQSPSRRQVSPSALPAVDVALERAGIAAPVRAAILRALAADPAARFPAIDDLLRALAPAPKRSRRTALALTGVLLCGGAVVAWFAVGRDERPSCIAEAPGRWSGAPRARVVAALAAVARPFAGWDGERIAGAIDGAVDALADAELARCRGVPLASSAGTAACIGHRAEALTAAIAALSASPPPDEPWQLVRPIQQCEAAASPGVAALRRELPAATAARARAIADAARKAGDDLLAADALEVAGLAALAAGDAAAADTDLLAMNEAGERAGDDAARGRALLHLVEVARRRGEYATAKRDLDELHAMLARHGSALRDELAVALVEGDAFTDLGDVATAFIAWDRAGAAAASLGDRDAALTAAIGRAWSTYLLRLDLAAARSDAAAALAAGEAASPASRAAALGVIADLAIAARDGSAAQTVIADAHRLVPAREQLLVDQLRGQRARALLGEIDAALASLSDLAAASPDDALTTARIGITRGKILLAAGRPGDAGEAGGAGRAGEARDVLEKVERDVRGFGRTLQAAPMPVPERIDLELATCEAQLATADRCKASYQVEALLKGLHPRAPARARFAIAEAGSDSLRPFPQLRSQHLVTALDILVDAHAEPVQIAQLRWQLAQLGVGAHDHRALATAAREVFQAHGRATEVADIDRWLAALPPGPVQPVAAPAVPTPDRDPGRARGPQP